MPATVLSEKAVSATDLPCEPKVGHSHAIAEDGLLKRGVSFGDGDRRRVVEYLTPTLKSSK